MSSSLDTIAVLAKAYAALEGVELTTVSWRLFGDSKKLAAIIDEGADLHTRRFEAAVRWLDENWPAGGKWPLTVERPSQISLRAQVGAG